MIPILLSNNTGYIFAPPASNSWALLNLMLVIIGIFLALLALIDSIGEKRRVRRKRIEFKNRGAKDTDLTGDGRNPLLSKLDWLITAEFLGCVSVLVFLLTQNINSFMVLINWMSIAHIVIFIVEVIALRLVYKPVKTGSK